MIGKKDDVVIRFGADDKDLKKALKGIGKSASSLTKSFGLLEGAITGFATGSGVSSIVNLNAEMEELRAGVEFAGGDFEKLREIAEDNAVAIEEVAEAYTRLKNLNLDSSRRSIEAYLNVAAGTRGKTLIDFAEAVADATVGEFERLKEFGIKASKAGNEVAISFRGNTKTIKNDAKEIEEALISIGEVEFAGAQAAKADTLSGAINNLSSAFNNLFISQEAAEKTTAAVKSLTETLSDPAVISGVNAFVAAIIKSVEGLAMIAGAAGGIAADIRSSVAAMSGFADLDRKQLIDERNKLNGLLAKAVVSEAEIAEKIEDGAFWLNGELKLQQDIIETTDEQIALISARLSLMEEETDQEEKTLDVKKKKNAEDKKSIKLMEEKDKKAKAKERMLMPGEHRQPTPEQLGEALARFRAGEISATELGRLSGLQAHDTIEPRPGAYGTMSNLSKPLPSTEGIFQSDDPMRPSPIGGAIQPATVMEHTFSQAMKRALDGQIYDVKVRPHLIDGESSDVTLQDNADKVGGTP